MRRGPLQSTEVNLDDLQSMIDQIQTEVNHGEESDPSVAEPDPESKKKVGQP